MSYLKETEGKAVKKLSHSYVKNDKISVGIKAFSVGGRRNLGNLFTYKPNYSTMHLATEEVANFVYATK